MGYQVRKIHSKIGEKNNIMHFIQKENNGESTSCKKFTSFMVVSQLALARGFSISDKHKEAMMPISGTGQSHRDYVLDGGRDH